MGFTGAIPSGDTTMNTRVLFFLFVFSLPATALQAQDCTALGQNPGTAFPVCGTSVFSQSVVPVCGIHTIPVACNDGASYMDKNPFWYKFTCFTSGTLGFVITPNDLGVDYDWQLFDITGHNPDEVYTNTALFVGANWSGETNRFFDTELPIWNPGVWKVDAQPAKVMATKAARGIRIRLRISASLESVEVVANFIE